ncbi:MAG: hypothetical protein ACRCVV_21845 [Shewanella sp.]
MPDIVDVASKHEAFVLQAAINNAKTKQEPALKKIGLCHNCFDVVGKDHLFCDADCSLDYETRRKRIR